MGYFKAPRKAKIKGAGLYFHWHPFRVCEVLDCGVIAAKRGPCLTDCISGFPAFAENDEKRNGNDGMGAFPAPSSPSPTHLRHPRCKARVHSWLTVFLDSLLSQRMTKRETGMREWGAYPAPSSPSRVPFYFLFFRNG